MYLYPSTPDVDFHEWSFKRIMLLEAFIQKLARPYSTEPDQLARNFPLGVERAAQEVLDKQPC